MPISLSWKRRSTPRSTRPLPLPRPARSLRAISWPPIFTLHEGRMSATASTRQLKFVQALNEALDLCMAKDPRVFIIGLGAPDPAAIFGSTKGLVEKYGPKRVLDMPVAENAITGVAVGAALQGMRPVMTHIRLEFAMLTIDQIVNQAAKWHYMFGGQASVPLVIRMVVGRGWGQGAQHSQSLQSWFAHVPGLKVVMPATPHDAKGLLIDRKSTRLNSSHSQISYAVFCLKKKKTHSSRR